MDKHIREIIGKCDDEAAPVLDKVIKDIFMSCDTENEGFVPVNKLIDFIMPFLQGNTHALDELQKSLDPNNRNPSIDIDTFYKDMNEWTLKISSADHVDDEDIHNVTPRDFERMMDKEVSFPHSTPRSSFGHHLLKGYVESGISNLSIASSLNESHNMYFPERTVLEEQIQQLQHQNRQVTEELTRVKMELTATAEHNETLQADLDKVLKKLAKTLNSSEQKLNAQLQSDRKVDDNCEEELCCTRKQVVKLERSLANLEKQNAQLQQELDAVVMEKQGLECQIQRLDRKSEETKSNMVVLQTEIDIRKSEVVSEQKTNEALSQHNQELCDLIEKCIINIERLKLEKAMLRKFYREKMNKGESLEGLNLNRSLRSNSFSEYAEISRKIVDRRRVSDVTARFIPGSNKSKPFNSPKLLRMLREPVSPNLDKSFKKTETNLATMILNRAATPYLKEQRSLLDMTPPIDLSKIPVLTPEHLAKRDDEAGEASSVATELLDLVLERVMGVALADGNLYSTPNSTDSPPVMYVVERTPDLVCEVPSPTTPFSPKMNDSSDEFFFYEMMSSTERQNENLLDEMAKATVCGIDEESECEESTTDSGDKKTYITEVQLKLDDYMDLEQKCEALEQRIEDLESENSLKDMKILELNNEIDKLRQKITSEDGNVFEGFRKRIDDLEKEKESHLSEKRHLSEEIKILNEEKAILQLSKEELLLKIVEYEKIHSGDHKKHLPNEFLSSKLKAIDKELLQTREKSSGKEDIECIKIDYDRVKSTMETYQKLNKNLSAKNGLLQKTIKEKEKLLEDNLEEIFQLREEAASLKDDVRKLHNNLEDYKRITSNLEKELIRKETDLEKLEENSYRNQKILEDLNSTLKIKELEQATLMKEIQNELEEKSKCLEEILATKEETRSDLKHTLEETKKKLEQEVKKQDYLCKKFVDLENELIAEKNSSAIFKETCEELQNDIANFKETLSSLAEQITNLQEQNQELSRENLNLYKSYEDKTKEIQSLIEAKSFIAKRNEELLQENSEIVHRYDIVSKELGNKMSLLEDMNRKLKEIDQLRVENRRIKIESEEILQKMKTLDGGEDSDQIDSSSRKETSLQKSRDRKLGRRANFDRLSAWNTKLEEKNAALLEEVAELRDRLTKEMEAKDSIVARMNTTKDILCERRIRLGRATDTAVDIWKPQLEKYIARNLFGEDGDLEDETLLFTGPLDEEMWQLKHQIHTTTMLLSHLTSFMNRQMLKKNVCTQTEPPEHSSNLYRIGEISTTRMEETFATLVLTYTVDKDLLHQRFHAKKIQLGEMERSLGEAVSALTLYLERNGAGLDVSNFMSNILQLCTQVSIAAVQYGSLRQQTELTAAAEMMVNYVANLRQEIELLTQQLPLVGTATTALDRIDFQAEEKPVEIEVSRGKSRKFISCVKTTCIMFTLSMFVLVASLVLNTDVVFKIHRCPPPT